MLNPIVFTERVVRDFLRYQLTTYPFADQSLHGQLRALLNLDETRQSPLMKGPYVSLSRPFRQGPRMADLCTEGVLHPQIDNLAPFPHVYGHQEAAIRAIAGGQTTLISTGTGSGKTESFLYPIISRCLEMRDVELFDGTQLEFMVFDEAHTFKGAQGAETACRVRRLRSFCGRGVSQTTCVAASATMVEAEAGADAGREFAARFFGVDPQGVEVVTDQYTEEEWATERTQPGPLRLPAGPALANVLAALGTDGDEAARNVIREVTGIDLPDDWRQALYARLAANDLLHRMVTELRQPRRLAEQLGREVTEE